MDQCPETGRNRIARAGSSSIPKPLPSEQLFKSNSEVNWTLLRDHLKREGRIYQEDAFRLLDIVGSIFST